jgi:hypothetical protein
MGAHADAEIIMPDLKIWIADGLHRLSIEPGVRLRSEMPMGT